MRRGVPRLFVTLVAMTAAQSSLAQLSGLHPVPLPTDVARLPDVRPDAVVLDSEGGAIGRVAAIDGGRVVIATGKSRVVVPATALRKRSGAFALMMSADKLDEIAARRTTPLATVRPIKPPPGLTR